jgi:hypothetical protein
MRRFWIVALPALIILSCICPATGGLQETIGAALTEVPGMLTELPEMMTELPGMLTDLPATVEGGMETPDAGLPGTIRGHLSYPSEYLPAQRIVAFDVATMAAVADVTTVEGHGEYELSVPAGNYFIVAYTLDGGIPAGYSQMVPCGLLASCTDHSLIPVHVDAGAVVEDINPQDWYAPPGSFPAMP